MPKDITDIRDAVRESRSTKGLDSFMEQFESTSLDEVLPQPVEVTWVDYTTTQATDEDGQPILDSDGNPELIRTPRLRRSRINTYVPMKVFHGMIASQERLKKVQALQKQIAEQGGTVASDEQGEMIGWLSEQVLAVWKLTEPSMTYDRLVEGVGFQKLFKLFSTFFGSLLREFQKGPSS